MSNIANTFGSFGAEGAKTTAQAMSSGDWIKFDKGVPKLIRILPPLAGESLPWVLIYQHFIKVGDKRLTVNCPRKMNVGPCPICEEYDRLMATGNPTDEAAAKENFRPSFRAIARAIDRERPGMVRPVGLSGTVVGLLNTIVKGKPPAVQGVDFTHHEHGYDLLIEYLGTSPWYTAQKVDQPSPIASSEAGILDIAAKMKAVNLADKAKVFDYNVLQAKLAELLGGGGSAAQPVGGFAAMPGGQPQPALGATPGSTINTSKAPF